MGLRKIIFLAGAGIIGLACIIGIIMLSKAGKQTVEVPKSLSIWITEWSTEEYKELIDGFYKYAPDYSKMKIQVEKKTSDPVRYRTLLLSTISDGSGPDIFMLKSGEDRVLESKTEPIPLSYFPNTDFERSYEDIFLTLLTGSLEERTTMWVPLGFETLGIFYNKWLLREVPKTWNEVEALYQGDFDANIFPSNLGLGPRYTPNSSDILPIFVWKENASYQDLSSWDNILKSYFSYWDIPVWNSSLDTNWEATSARSLRSITDEYDATKETTYDAFLRGEIGFIVWFPSVVQELEKSAKRIGSDSAENLILTERVPQDSLSERKKNLARYTYFSLSKESENDMWALKFLEYLTTDDALRTSQVIHPYFIPPKPSLYSSWQDNALSSVLTRTKLDVFIPVTSELLMLFDYGLKAEFNDFMSENIDRNKNIDIDNLWNRLASFIECNIGLFTWEEMPDCEK